MHTPLFDSRQLEALLAVAEHGSFGAAALALALTPAAVSLRIKALETHLAQRLLVRGKTVTPTPAGQRLLAHARQLQLLQTDLRGALGSAAQDGFVSLSVGVNADSLAHWFIPGVADLLRRQALVLDVVVDDQDHTLQLLHQGEVTGCVSTRRDAMPGCVAQALGTMRYRALAALDLHRALGSRPPLQALVRTPAVVFNRKDGLHDAFLAQHYHARAVRYPRHYVPSLDALEQALALGLGWGIHRDPPRARRGQPRPKLPWVDLCPGQHLDVPLYWHHWAREPLAAQLLSAAVVKAARAALLPPPA